MKAQILSTVALLLMTGMTALAVEPATHTTVWEGSGAVEDLQGKITANYQLTVVVIRQGARRETDVTVTFEGGEEIKQACSSTAKADGSWTEVCDFGRGAGRELGEGMAISYVAEGEHAFATTIVMDGTEQMRLLRTELQNGKATRFFREKLHKKD